MKIEWLLEARCVFRDFLVFYQTQVGMKYARRFAQRVLSDVRQLGQFPELGVLRKDTLPGRHGFRALFIGQYVCIYKIVEDRVLIYHLTDARRNYIYQIFGMEEPENEP